MQPETDFSHLKTRLQLLALSADAECIGINAKQRRTEGNDNREMTEGAGVHGQRIKGGRKNSDKSLPLPENNK